MTSPSRRTAIAASLAGLAAVGAAAASAGAASASTTTFGGAFARDAHEKTNQTLWEDNGTGGERALDGREASGLQVEVYQDCVIIKARDYRRGQWIKEVQVPLF